MNLWIKRSFANCSNLTIHNKNSCDSNCYNANSCKSNSCNSKSWNSNSCNLSRCNLNTCKSNSCNLNNCYSNSCSSNSCDSDSCKLNESNKESWSTFPYFLFFSILRNFDILISFQLFQFYKTEVKVFNFLPLFFFLFFFNAACNILVIY